MCSANQSRLSGKSIVVPYGNAGDVFTVGGWMRGYAKKSLSEVSYGTRCYINVTFYSGGTWTSGGISVWNHEEGTWQFVSGRAVAPVNYTHVRCHIQYYQQMNYTDFTNFFLSREEFGTKLGYDAKGNKTSARSLAHNTTAYEYDAFNNKTSYQQPGRTLKTIYTYGQTDAEKKRHLTLSATSPLGTVSENTFDFYATDTSGNPLPNPKGLLMSGKIKGTVDGTERTIQSGASYTANGNYALTQTDARGKVVQTSTDLNRGTTLSVTDPDNHVVEYEYDGLRRAVKVKSTANGTLCQNTYVYNDKDDLTQLRHNTSDDAAGDVVYNFEYDALHRQKKVSVGLAMLAENEYNANGTLKTVYYGNGGQTRSTYDSFKRLVGVQMDNDTADRYEYAYNADGVVAHVKDNLLGRIAQSEYDTANRPMRIKHRTLTGEHLYTGEIAYDVFGNLAEFKENVGASRTAYKTTFGYDVENRPTLLKFGNEQNKVENVYDGLGRLKTRTVTVGGNAHACTYSYVEGG